MFGHIKDMMGKLQEAQKEAEKIKSNLDSVILEEDSGEIKIKITGNREIKDLEISEALLSDREELQDKLVIALNKAIAKAGEKHEQEMQGAAKGMLPGMDMFK